MSFCVCTPPSPYAKPGSMQAAMTLIVRPIRIDMLKSSLDRDCFGCTAAARWAAAFIRVAKTAADILLQLIGHLGDTGLAARLFLRPAIRGAAETDATDGLLADLDRNTALQRNDFGKAALALRLGLGALRPLNGGAPERPRRIGLALGELEIVRRGSVAHNKGLHSACTINDRNRHPRRAFGPRRFCDRERHA